MTNPDSSPGAAGGTDGGVNRRTVLKGAGVGALAGVGLVGTASGHEVEEPPVFCGCEALCVCVAGNADVLVARETDDGGYDVGFVVGGGDLDPYPQGEPYYSGHFCVSTADPEVPDGKIIGLQVAGNRWVNPNACAQDALAAEQRQLDSTHPRPVGRSGQACATPPCEDPDDGDGGDDVDVTWEDCETVRVTGSAEWIEEIVVQPLRCFPDGPCPDGVPGGRTIENPDLPLTIDDRYLAVDGGVDYYIAGIELRGDGRRESFGKPGDLDCDFDSTPEIDVTWEDCETVRVTGSDEGLDEIIFQPIRCFPEGPCPDGVPGGRTIENPTLPLTIDDRYMAVDGDEVDYYIVGVELVGDVDESTFSKPDDLDCDFDSVGDCQPCDAGTDLLEKWEFVQTAEDCGFERETDKGDDPDIGGVMSYLNKVDEGGQQSCEPRSVTFATDYCDGTLDAVVKAGPELVTQENLSVSNGEVTVTTGGVDYTISNVRFYCDAPDDATSGMGNGGGRRDIWGR